MKSSLITTPNILFAALSAVFFAFAFRPLPPSAAPVDDLLTEHHYVPTSADRNSLSLKAQQYKMQLAAKLNRQRIDTEYEATFASRAEQPHQSATASEDDLSFGVEAIRKHASDERAVDAQQPEMQVRADLWRQQVLAQQSARASAQSRAQFIAQYVANARAEGYVVKVDKDLNVEVVSGPSGGREPQSVEDGPVSGEITVAFELAPFCR